MRYLFGLVAVCVGVVPLTGCASVGSEGNDGDRFPCTEQGIRDAITQGGGPHFFACSGPTAIAAPFTVDNDVILDGEEQLETDTIEVLAGVTAELRGFHIRNQYLRADYSGVLNDGDLRMTNCSVGGFDGEGVWTNGTLTLVNSRVFSNAFGGIYNRGKLTITDSSVSGNSTGADHEDWGAGIHNTGTLTLANSTVSANRERGLRGSGGIYNAGGFVTLTNSTVSENDGDSAGGIFNAGTVTIANVTVSSNTSRGASVHNEEKATVMNSLIDGDCEGEIISNGYNIESPDDTCGFDPDGTDLVNVPDPMLGPLQDNGGPTQTHPLLPGSVAIDHIPAVDCEVTEDQRGEPRPETGGMMCDVGSFERQPEDL